MSAAAGDVRGVCPLASPPCARPSPPTSPRQRELGARFALAIDGEIVVDLMGGWADRAMTRPFAEDTLTPVFSTTKAMTSLMIARLVGEGRLAYDTRVADLWPEFAEAGKDRLTVGQTLSHQAGLCGLRRADDARGLVRLGRRLRAAGGHGAALAAGDGQRLSPGDLRLSGRRDLPPRRRPHRWGPRCARMSPCRSVSTCGSACPTQNTAAVAQVRRPPAMPDLGEITEPRRLAFLTRWATPGGVDEATARRAEIPSANGHATAPALARLMAILAKDGTLDGRRVLAPGVAAEAGREQIAGPDLVLPYEMSWGAGFIRNAGLGVYGSGRETFGHSGWGGSCAFADPESGVSGAYVMNRQSAELIADAGRDG